MVEDWNAKYPPGTSVSVNVGDKQIVSVTEGPALLLGGSTPAISIKGLCSYFALDRVTPQNA